MKEKFGCVTIHYDFYTGDDFYNDGPVEDYLLEEVKKYQEPDFDQIIINNPIWPVYYHLSYLRHNIINWYNFDKEKTALEIGSGCGAITGLISESCKSVTCVELSKKRSLINAYRNIEKNNIDIWVCNFEDFVNGSQKKYDYIFLIGVLEYAEKYIHSTNSQEIFLKRIRQMLNPGGIVFIAIENKTGMKYWAGCSEDHLGVPFIGIEDYPDATGIRTFTRKELEELLQRVGFDKATFYYPYPDYKFPYVIYSDSYLPNEGELIKNRDNFDQNRLLLFNETFAFDNIIRNNMFPFFSNSYLLLVEVGD